tara:strand:+ start:379 stop:879 length:501 start_codon:yes stop_codon:yes gene_type:complete
MKKIFFFCLITIVIVSCAISIGNTKKVQTKESDKINEEQVMSAFHNLFEVLDKDVNSFQSLVTDDFFIFENSRRYSTKEFIEFVKTFDIISSKRRYENISIDTDYNSAHLSLTQFGEFIINTPDGKVKLEFEWLESTYLVKQGGKLKFKFYFSEAIKTDNTLIENK